MENIKDATGTVNNVKQIKIWNTHYQAATDTWRVTVIKTDGKQFTIPMTMRMEDVQDYISEDVLAHMP